MSTSGQHLGFDEVLVDVDPPGKGYGPATPVVAKLDAVPDRARSSGWGDMSWTRDAG